MQLFKRKHDLERKVIFAFLRQLLKQYQQNTDSIRSNTCPIETMSQNSNQQVKRHELKYFINRSETKEELNVMSMSFIILN